MKAPSPRLAALDSTTSLPSGRATPREGALDEPERRVVRQLVEALLFEGLVSFRSAPRAPGSGFAAIYDRDFAFRLGQVPVRCVGAVSSFGRIRVAEGSIEHRAHGVWREAPLRQLVESLDVDAEARQRLLTELTQTVALCRWNRAHLAHHLRPRRGLSFQELESALHEGHPYHPSFKARAGFSLEDHRDYGPEAATRFQLQWLAVDARRVRTALPEAPERFWARELGERVYAELTTRLTDQGASWDDRALLPVHPWQLRALDGPALRQAFTERVLLPLGPAGDRYRASQSLRTLLNADRPEASHVKLPLATVCTSSPRHFRAHFVCTAPAVSEWLGAVVGEDPFLRDRAVLLREYAAALFTPSPRAQGAAAPHGAEALEGMLGVILRESVVTKLAPGEEAVPFNALTVVEADGRPFIAEWLDAHGVEAWVARLLEVMLLPLWHLLVHHGIAFEAHPQNLILLHRGGWPERLALRDFHDDTEYVADFLRRPELLPDLGRIDPYFDTVPDDDGYRMASTDDLRELFTDTAYVFNLADLSFLLERHAGFVEELFWERTRQALAAYGAAGMTEPERIARVACDAPELPAESLLEKKLRGGRLLDFFSHPVPNPLSPKSVGARAARHRSTA